jgi:hypothetical protein
MEAKVIDKSNVFEHIISCANALDRLYVQDYDRCIYVPDFMYDMAEQEISQRAALARFKLNSSFWPNQFDWMP